MSAHQRVLFTALPNGLDADVAGRCRLSVHVSPRLTFDQGDTELASFPEWIDWPATVGAFSWSVVLGAGPPIAATATSAAPRSDLWTALFAKSTLVRSQAPGSFADRVVRSFPARNVQAFLRDRYTNAALSSPTEFPGIDDLLSTGGLGQLGPGFINGSGGGAQVEIDLAADKAFVNGAPLADIPKDFYQLVRFHRSRRSSDNVQAPVPKPTLDFHEAVSTLGQQPPLMRLLGLVVDLTFDIGDLPPSPTDVRVVPGWDPETRGPDDSTAIGSVRTRCLITASSFQARPRQENPELVNGRLPLNDPARYTVIQEDLDGAGEKLVDFVANLRRLKDNGLSSASPEDYAVPSLRSGGLSVARTNRAPRFHEHMGRAETGSKLAGAADPALVVDAEDVTRGHHIDIRDTREGRWFPLTARTGSYRFVGTGVDVPYTDEGWVTAAPTEDDATDLYLQETLFQWGGWSLAAPRPGSRLATGPGADPPLTDAPDAPGDDFPVLIEVRAAPGSLPRLRFGRTYEVRARAVDLAGNSVPLDPDNRDPLASPPLTYGRFEVVQTPPVLPSAPRTEGESLERVVLRSNYNTDPGPGDVARHIVPPKADQLMAEHHGLFDTPLPGSVVDPGAYATISGYPGLADPADPVVQSEQGSFDRSSEAEADPDDFEKTFYFPVQLVKLPYLPDPIARGATLRFLDLPKQPGFQLKVPFSPRPAWPKHQPVRLVVVQGPAAEPTYREDTHTIEVPLRKGDVVHVRLSAHLQREDLAKLGLWQWIFGGGGAGLAQDVIDGRHWMVTPYRTLTLVHAVRQPLDLAMFAPIGESPGLVLHKALGKTFVNLAGNLHYSRRTTSRIDVIGEWVDFVDDGPGTSKPTPASAPVARRAVAFSVSGDRGPGPNAPGPDSMLIGPASPNDRHEFGDTKHRKVGYSTVATTRFSEYFLQRREVTVSFGQVGGYVVPLDTGGKGIVSGSVGVKNKVTLGDKKQVVGARTYAENLHFVVAEGGITIKKGAAGFVPDGQTVVITWLSHPVTRPGPDEKMVPLVRSVLSSARPASPRLQYVLPTFGWESKVDPIFGTRQSKRLGNGLRIYLDRPWWSSGEGELLGVVLEDPGHAPSQTLAGMLSRYGVDPVFRSTTTSFPHPRAQDFPDAVAVKSGLTVPGTGGLVRVAGHEVGFDVGRDLWYCDVRLHTRSYFPFVRLGLARFQPNSVPGVEMSAVVMTDFAQLAPDRSVSVTLLPAPPGVTPTRRVMVTGQSYDRAAADDVLALVRVTLEYLELSENPDLGWTPSGVSVNLGSQPSGDSTVWIGDIVVPPAEGGRKRRLVIEEFERHRTGMAPVFGERLVYSDTIPL